MGDDLGASSSIRELSALFGWLVLILSVLLVSLSLMNRKAIKYNQYVMQDALHNATVAYSVQYNFSYSGLASIAEGYLIDEDIDRYRVATNPVTLDTNRAGKFFYKCLYGTTGIKESSARKYDLTMFVITTMFRSKGGDPIYVLSSYKDTDTIVENGFRFSSAEELQKHIEGYYGIGIDISEKFNSDLRKAQEYAEKNRTTKIGGDVYSSYNTYMVIGKDIPIPGIFGSKKCDMTELQTYSIER